MDDQLQRIFLLEINFQCELIAVAAHQLRNAEADSRANGIDENLGAASTRIKDNIAAQWLALQTIVVSAANLSKLLWGSGGRRDGERKVLRDRLAVDDDSCLQSPDLRNDFEHFDERIERRFTGEDIRGYIARNIGDVDSIHIEGEEPNTRFGHYDPSTGVLSFWANAVNVFEVIAETQRILPLARDEALKAYWVE